jgi:hypothetical protein
LSIYKNTADVKHLCNIFNEFLNTFPIEKRQEIAMNLIYNKYVTIHGEYVYVQNATGHILTLYEYVLRNFETLEEFQFQVMKTMLEAL